MMTSLRNKKVSELIRKLASDFISKETNKTSLITVTKVDLSFNFKSCNIFVSVFPDSKAKSALHFLKRQRRFLKQEVKKKTNLKTIPFFDFQIDYGEKNRQRIDEISSNIK